MISITEHTPEKHHLSSTELRHRIIAFTMIVIPFSGFIVAVAVSWGHAVDLPTIAVCGIMYLFTAFGVTMGYHRLFTHKSFTAKRWLKITLAIAGAMAAEGPLFFWCAMHRRHHQHSDTEYDPHSPHHHGSGVKGILHGVIHSHFGWMLAAPAADYRKYIPDLLKDRDLIWISRHYWKWNALGFAIPAGVLFVIEPSFASLLKGALWGGLVRIFLLHHATWSVNSLCHMFGSAPFQTKDQSKNNALCAIWSLGEGWHNNHHAFPTSARHGLTMYQLDPTFILIKLGSFLGFVTEIKQPSPIQRISKIIDPNVTE